MLIPLGYCILITLEFRPSILPLLQLRTVLEAWKKDLQEITFSFKN